MPLSTQDREKIRYHLGYLNVQPAASITFGVPRPQQTLFLVETAMSNVLEESIPRVRQIVSILDSIECKLVDAQDRLKATELAELKLRRDETDALEHEYLRWASRLADLLGVPLYAYSIRFASLTQRRVGNVPVVRS